MLLLRKVHKCCHARFITWHVEKTVNFSQLLAVVIGIENNLHSSADEHLLLLMKSKIDYLKSQALKDGLPEGHIGSDCMEMSRVTPLIFQQCDHATNK